MSLNNKTLRKRKSIRLQILRVKYKKDKMIRTTLINYLGDKKNKNKAQEIHLNNDL